jgi:hypothetical protein
MSNKKRLMYCVLVALLLLAGLAIYNRCSKAEVVRVERDTVIVHDTIVDVAPVPKDSVRTRWITRWLPAKRDTASRNGEIFPECPLISANFSATDTVAVQVPITSKHYSGDSYDAWVSGFEPSLDSIKVYRETQYITERVTISKPPNKWELDVMGGINYNFNKKKYTPYAGGELLYKPSRLQVGVRGGVIKNDNFEPTIGAVVKYRLF